MKKLFLPIIFILATGFMPQVQAEELIDNIDELCGFIEEVSYLSYQDRDKGISLPVTLGYIALAFPDNKNTYDFISKYVRMTYKMPKPKSDEVLKESALIVAKIVRTECVNDLYRIRSMLGNRYNNTKVEI